MNKVIGNVTVYFEEPFWVGVFERIENDRLSVCKVTFGAEPKKCELWSFLLRHYATLLFSEGVLIEPKRRADNPKRRQRMVQQQMRHVGIGTRSQQALAAQRDAQKTERKAVTRAQKEAESERRFVLKQQKRKDKHRGH